MVNQDKERKLKHNVMVKVPWLLWLWLWLWLLLLFAILTMITEAAVCVANGQQIKMCLKLFKNLTTW